MIDKVEISLILTVTIPMITAALWAHLLKEVACLQISTMMVQPKLFARDLGRLGSTIGNKVKFGNITSVWVKSSNCLLLPTRLQLCSAAEQEVHHSAANCGDSKGQNIQQEV